ncbi:BEM_collapsed_G0058380.mRNA.1.CDS.1 [Saccharomyces cerevisiae]|nr:BEM_collapsed_G0058380.mRNA.1.CDS.1 [Saccharomyces cerevisiae]
MCYRINYQSMDRNLTNAEVNTLQDMLQVFYRSCIYLVNTLSGSLYHFNLCSSIYLFFLITKHLRQCDDYIKKKNSKNFMSLINMKILVNSRPSVFPLIAACHRARKSSSSMDRRQVTRMILLQSYPIDYIAGISPIHFAPLVIMTHRIS